MGDRQKIVKLNIGGFKYCTTSTTLTKIPNTFFTALLSDNIPTTKDEEDAYFVGKCAWAFGAHISWALCRSRWSIFYANLDLVANKWNLHTKHDDCGRRFKRGMWIFLVKDFLSVCAWMLLVLFCFFWVCDTCAPPTSLLTLLPPHTQARFYCLYPLVDELTYQPPPTEEVEGSTNKAQQSLECPPEIDKYVAEYWARHENTIFTILRCACMLWECACMLWECACMLWVFLHCYNRTCRSRVS